MVDSDVARVLEFNRCSSGGHVKDAHQKGTDSSSATLLRRDVLIPDSMRKTTQANFDTKTLKAFRDIFAHNKNADAKISDWVSYIPVDHHTQVRVQIRSVADPKPTQNDSLQHKWTIGRTWMCIRCWMF